MFNVFSLYHCLIDIVLRVAQGQVCLRSWHKTSIKYAISFNFRGKLTQQVYFLSLHVWHVWEMKESVEQLLILSFSIDSIRKRPSIFQLPAIGRGSSRNRFGQKFLSSYFPFPQFCHLGQWNKQQVIQQQNCTECTQHRIALR